MFEPVLTSFVREPDSFTLDVALAHGAYEGLRKALTMSPAQVAAAVRAFRPA
jgi:NADH:ubiquinone oxidoreductase subunit F (NADH-binding)